MMGHLKIWSTTGAVYFKMKGRVEGQLGLDLSALDTRQACRRMQKELTQVGKALRSRELMNAFR